MAVPTTAPLLDLIFQICLSLPCLRSPAIYSLSSPACTLLECLLSIAACSSPPYLVFSSFSFPERILHFSLFIAYSSMTLVAPRTDTDTPTTSFPSQDPPILYPRKGSRHESVRRYDDGDCHKT